MCQLENAEVGGEGTPSKEKYLLESSQHLTRNTESSMDGNGEQPFGSEPLFTKQNGTVDVEQGENPACLPKYKLPLVRGGIGVLVVIVVALTIAVALLAEKKCDSFVMRCPDDWIEYQGKCFYFSNDKKSWDSSQTSCSSLGASLARIDTQKEMNFTMRYKGQAEYWIGLRREQDQPWTWVNSTEFNSLLFRVQADGNCAYLSHNFVGSTGCSTLRHWVCTKPHKTTRAEDDLKPGARRWIAS